MADSIQIKSPDGSEKEVPKGTTARDVAKSISPRLADAAFAAKIEDYGFDWENPDYVNLSKSGTTPPILADKSKLIDLVRPLDRDLKLRILTDKDPEALGVYRHSSAHLLAAAVLELFPETKLGHGPATESGFFYDFYRETPFTPEDLAKIEKKMQELVQQDLPYAREFLPRNEGLERFKNEGDFMKCHFIEQFIRPDEKISIYKTGKFLDFCRGPHIPSTGKIKAFKLLNIAGAYWLGDEKNPQLQRIYGTSFFSKKDLDQYLHQIEEAKKRDHRALGQQLDLFSIQELAGPGLIFWHPKGGLMRKLMEDWMRDEYLKRGYSLVYTPHIVRRKLFEVTGHEGFYTENMFPVMEMEDGDYRAKPMNCPGHILIYRDGLRSYRDLPMRLGELGTVYRYERSGVMHGLMRVRGFTQDDAHIFCTPEQIEDEIVGCIDFALAVLTTYGFKEFQSELSTWDPADRGHYLGSDADWELANRSLENAMKRRNLPYKIIPGEAAFYGPKIDVKLVDAIGRLWQLSTVQFDFNLPERFQLEYVAADGSRQRPVMVHRGAAGSMERLFSYLIERYAGAFPTWLHPVQVVVAPLTDAQHEAAREIADRMRRAKIRVELDARNQKVDRKVRDAKNQKVPYIVVIGPRDVEAGLISVNNRAGERTQETVEAFVERVTTEIADRRR